MNNQPLEIEYKYLIQYPDVNKLSQEPQYRSEELFQAYLSLPKGLDPNGENCRIRSVRTHEDTKYIKTFKTNITALTRIEIESEITEEEFQSLMQYVKPDTTPIRKTRHSFELFGFTYEVDVFPFWEDRAFLEVEVDSEDTKPPFPDCIKVIKDISADRRYRNSALAHNIFTEDLD